MDDIPPVEEIIRMNVFMTSTFLTVHWLGNLHDEASKSTRRMFS